MNGMDDAGSARAAPRDRTALVLKALDAVASLAFGWSADRRRERRDERRARELELEFERLRAVGGF